MPTKEDRRILVQIRLSEQLVKEVDHLAVDWGKYRSEAIERLLQEAIEKYSDQKSLWPRG